MNKSGPAIFMYIVIILTILISATCFITYYCYYENNFILWTGIVAFMIMYHFGLRIIFGNITKLFSLNRNSWWFKERRFEKGLYKFLKVKKWKGRALTYNPELFSIKDRTLDQIADTMTKAELDHWINELISVSSIFFALIWGKFWIFY